MDRATPKITTEAETGEDAGTTVDYTRRLYIGNLPYRTQKSDVEDLLSKNDLPYRNIDFSTDPFTGRGPGYCFVDLCTVESLSRALEILPSQKVSSRLIKVNIVMPKRDRHNDQRPPTRVYDSWKPRDVPSCNTTDHARESSAGDRFSRAISAGQAAASDLDIDPAKSGPTASSPYAFDRWTRNDAKEHWTAPPSEGRRLYVGGLPQIPRQDTVNVQIGALFGSTSSSETNGTLGPDLEGKKVGENDTQGFTVQAISKIISPSAATRRFPGNHYYVFVDLPSAAEAQRAVSLLDGTMMSWGGRVKVGIAKGGPDRKVVHEQLGGNKKGGYYYGKRDLSSSWRRD